MYRIGTTLEQEEVSHQNKLILLYLHMQCSIYKNGKKSVGKKLVA